MKLPWADDGLKVVFGTEWRREKLTSLPDAEYQAGDLAGIGSPTPPVNAGQHVWEAFTEERMPLAKNLPGVKALDLETGYRYSSYSEGYNTNTYKIGLEWAPVEDVRIRGSFNRAVRAPNLQELYQPAHVGLDIGGDLCAGKTSLTEAQCALLGVTPAQYATGVAGSPAAQYNGKTGGNPNVKPEVGITKEIGVVFTPSFLPGFNATIDYSDIRISNLINSYGPNTIQSNCIASGDVNGSWCELVHRDPTGTLWASQNAYTIDTILNEGEEEYKGIRHRARLPDQSRQLRADPHPVRRHLAEEPGLLPRSRSVLRLRRPVRPVVLTDYADLASPLDRGLGYAVDGLVGGCHLAFLRPGYQHVDRSQDAGLPRGTEPDPGCAYSDDQLPRPACVVHLGQDHGPRWCQQRAGQGSAGIDTANSGGNQIYAESNTFPSVYDTLGRYLFLNVTVDF